MAGSIRRVIAATFIGVFTGWWLFAGACVVPKLRSSQMCVPEGSGSLLFCFIIGCVLSWIFLERIAARKRLNAELSEVPMGNETRQHTRWVALVVTGACSLISVVLLCSILLGGVILPGTPWRKEPWEGPLLIEGKRAVTLSRCALFPAFMSRGPCEDVFVDHRGDKVLLGDIRDSADDTLENVPALAYWVDVKKNKGSCCWTPARTEAPYELPYVFYIATISPTVVLATPHAGYDVNNSCGSRFSGGCLGSYASRVGYFYRREIPVVAETIAFFPDQPHRLESAPLDLRQWVIDLKDSQLRLVAENGTWRVTRVGVEN